MTTLAIRTDSSHTTLAIFRDGIEVARDEWESGRSLARELLGRINELCVNAEESIGSLQAIICYEGPGSFTGLRIGITVANTLAYSNGAPIVGVTGEDWISAGLKRLGGGENEKMLIPKYGSEPNITM